jgi:lysyl-tRNA synthetase class 1
MKASRRMNASFSIPSTISEVIERFNNAQTPFTELDVDAALSGALKELKQPTPAERKGAWCEWLAFALTRAPERSVWGTCFGPSASGITGDGKPFYVPDIAQADAEIVSHWMRRAGEVTHPVLKARYADLVWDIGPVITHERGSHVIARIAVDAYLDGAALPFTKDLYDRFHRAFRAWILSAQLGDTERKIKAKDKILALHGECMTSDGPCWWMAYDFLAPQRGALSEDEKNDLVADLEKIVSRCSGAESSSIFDPHTTKTAAQRLIKHYTRLGNSEAVRRLYQTAAKVTERHASLCDAMLASVFLQESLDAYRYAGLKEDADRIRILMQEKIRQAGLQMKPVVTELKIAQHDMDQFLAAVVTDDIGATFIRLAAQFLPSRAEVEKQVQNLMKVAPLTARVGISIMSNNRVAAKVGSVEDDPFGRLVHQANLDFDLSDIWLHNALVRLFEKHDLGPEHFVAWANRTGLFEETAFLIAGVTAWLDGDPIKALHVLVPQVEHGLRQIVGKLGRPVTRAHPSVSGISVAVGMGDILYSVETTELLGPDLTLYFLALYADPRGINLRNQLAHGLLVGQAPVGLVKWVVHTLLVFGIWKELAEKRR